MGLKDSVKRRTHKERSQPAARRRYGLLEKKKDYLLRAKDYHKKEATIKTLKRKAEERNPDEFYFSMENARTKDGVHITRSTEANKYTTEQLRLMKSQDAGYLNLKAQSEAKKVEKMRESLHLIGAPAAGRQHVVFVDDEEEAEQFNPAQHFDTPAELLGRAYNRPRSSQIADIKAVSAGTLSEKLVARTERRKMSAYKELVQRQERSQVLGKLAQKMEHDRQLMGKGRRRKLGPEETDNPKQKVFRFKAERSK